MTKQEFIENTQTIGTNASIVNAINHKFFVSVPNTIEGIFMILPQGGFLEGKDFCRVMATAEIVSANDNLHTDFVGKRLIPFLDLGENIFVVFDCDKQEFGRYSLNDDLVYMRAASLKGVL